MNRCEINSIWLPRQVNSKTYHCVHGEELSGGEATHTKKTQTNEPPRKPPFTRTFRESLFQRCHALGGMLRPPARLLRRVMSDLCGDGALALLLLLMMMLSCCELSRQCTAAMGAQSACALRVTAGAANKQQTGCAGTIVTAGVRAPSQSTRSPKNK